MARRWKSLPRRSAAAARAAVVRITAHLARTAASPKSFRSSDEWASNHAVRVRRENGLCSNRFSTSINTRPPILRASCCALPARWNTGTAPTTCMLALSHLNQVLQVEGLEIALDGVSPRLRQTTATVAPPKPVYKREPAPDFRKLVADAELADILCFRWEEAQRCVEAGAHLAAVVMMGSILEGVLLHKVEQNIATANSAKAAPKEKATGKPRPIGDWGISVLIDVAHEVGWLQGDMKRFSHALRESRNIVHPYLQRLLKENPDHDTCAICWQVVRAGVADLLEVESKTPRGTGA